MSFISFLVIESLGVNFVIGQIMSFHVISCHVISNVIGLFRPAFHKVGGGRGWAGSNVSSKDFGDSFAVRLKAKMH
jgi:hypothetical protein